MEKFKLKLFSLTSMEVKKIFGEISHIKQNETTLEFQHSMSDCDNVISLCSTQKYHFQSIQCQKGYCNGRRNFHFQQL